ncbi:MAG: DUF4040 domain-containing protein [Actinomycetota bacterium]|nr:DUF4040 domain-containing protein [Actinomycetota bacterium]
MTSVLLVHAAVAAVAPVLGRRLGRGTFLVAAIAPLSALAWLGVHARDLVAGVSLHERWAWVTGLDLAVDLRVDAFGALMVLLVAGIGTLVFVYSAEYFHGTADAGRVAAALTGFAAAMLGLVMADHLLVLYVFWELTSLTSYVLIAGDGTDADAREAAQHALFVTVVGGFTMLAGFVVLGQAAGTYRLSELSAGAAGPATTGAALLILVGAFTKSAQAPFHGWLPAAMVAPTPISAYLHSATMVKAGVYLIARLAPVLAVAVVWRSLTVGIGLATAVFAAVRALRQDDLKLLLAYGTISQLGLMTALLGPGIPALSYTGVAVLVAHALYKAPLFMVVGNIDHAAGSRNLRRLRGVARAMPLTAGGAVLVGASMLGIPPLLGYVAHEAVLKELLHVGVGWAKFAVAAVVGTFALTVTYSLRFLLGGLTDRDLERGPVGEVTSPEHEAGWLSLTPILLLTVVSVVAGLGAHAAGEVVSIATESLGLDTDAELKLWAGFNPALALSVIAIAAGVAMYAATGTVTAALRRLPRLPEAGAVFRAVVAATVRSATRVTAVVQNGSLPVYVAMIAVTAVAVPSAGLLTGPAWERSVSGTAPALQVVVAAPLVAAAVGLTLTHRRFVALLFLGAVGYGMAVLFLLQGAPDLALTQVLIETVAVLLFVLVLRHLPETFTPPRWAFGRVGRFAISAAVGLFVMALAVVASTVDHPPGIASEYLARALPEAEGKNVVNVILVDFRALDTLGEITVLVVAALGIAGILRHPSTDETRPRMRPLFPDEERSLIAETTIRAIYPAVLLVSIYFLVAGHNHPGGGFVGGLVAGAALILRYVARGPLAVRNALPLSAPGVVAVGLLVAVGTAVAGWWWGETFLDATTWAFTAPIVHHVKVSSTLAFDAGVYLIVVGFIANALQAFGQEPGG